MIQEKCLNMPVEGFVGIVGGKRIEHVTSRGKWVFAKLSGDVSLLLNLGMGGDAILHNSSKGLPEKYQVRFDNQPGGVREFLVGYREGQACPECGTTIQKIETGSTSSYICANCQR